MALGLLWAYADPSIVEGMGRGWDWVWLDGQHGRMGDADIVGCVRAADGVGVSPIVRVPGHESGFIGRALDTRPAGVMVPLVNTADEARRIVQAVYFPPLGQRSFGGRRVVDLGGLDYHVSANDDVLLVAQIETPEAVDCAEAIAGVEGVDVLFFGGDDMKLRLGIPMDTPVTESDRLAEAMRATAAAARAAGKWAGCVASTPTALALAMSMGYRLVAGGSDVGFLRTAAAAALTELRQVCEEHGKESC